MNRIEMIDRKSALRSALLGASAITAIGAPMASPAFAQESVFREEIVVTAQSANKALKTSASPSRRFRATRCKRSATRMRKK